MSKKGFTLIELLGTIVILGILTTIAIVSVNKIMQSSHEKYYDKQKEMFRLAGQEYFSDHKELLPTINYATNKVTLSKLIEENYINKIVDYKKRVCNQDESYVFVKRIGVSKYEYGTYLICPDRKDTNDYDDSKSIGTTINLTYISGGNYDTFDKKYYTNNQISFKLIMNNVDGLSGYKYVIYKLNKKYMTSEVISASSNKEKTITDTITINKETCSDGEYYIGIIPIDKNGNEQDVQRQTDTKIVIDTINPKCNIEVLEGTKGKNDWYIHNKNIEIKSEQLTLKLDVKEKNLNQYSFNNKNMQSFTTSTSLERTFYEHQEDTTDLSGANWIAIINDKAGNQGQCNINVKYDKNPPTVKVTKEGGVLGNNGWYKEGTTLSNPVNLYAQCNDGKIGSGCNNSTKTLINRYYGNLQRTDRIIMEDNAGNESIIETTTNIDVTKPICNIGTPNDNNEGILEKGNRTDLYKNKVIKVAGNSNDPNGNLSIQYLTHSGKNYERTNKYEDNHTGGGSATWRFHAEDKAGNYCNADKKIKQFSCPTMSVQTSINKNNWTNKSIPYKISGYTGLESNSTYIWYQQLNTGALVKNSSRNHAGPENTLSLDSSGIIRGFLAVYINNNTNTHIDCPIGDYYHIDKIPPTIYSGYGTAGFWSTYRYDDKNPNNMLGNHYIRNVTCEDKDSGFNYNTAKFQYQKVNQSWANLYDDFFWVPSSNKKLETTTNKLIRYNRYWSSGQKNTNYHCTDAAGNTSLYTKDSQVGHTIEGVYCICCKNGKQDSTNYDDDDETHFCNTYGTIKCSEKGWPTC